MSTAVLGDEEEVEVVDPTPTAAEEHDTSDDLFVGPPALIDACEARLGDAKVRFESARIPVHTKKGGLVCGAPQIVRYKRGPTGIRWGKGPKVTCGVATAMARFETIVQEEARRFFNRDVVKVKHMGTYNCREMAAYPGWVSEHSYANAIDIKAFVLRGGREVTVLGNYGTAQEPRDDKERFLQAVSARAYDEDVFSVVLTPAFDRAHRNHFHLDLARYRVDGTGRLP